MSRVFRWGSVKITHSNTKISKMHTENYFVHINVQPSFRKCNLISRTNVFYHYWDY